MNVHTQQTPDVVGLTKVAPFSRRGFMTASAAITAGYTLAAGECLLFAATRNGHSLIGVALDSSGTGMTVNGADATAMLNWAFRRVE